MDRTFRSEEIVDNLVNIPMQDGSAPRNAFRVRELFKEYFNSPVAAVPWQNNKYIFFNVVCKARWNNIRDNYRRSKKRRMTKSGQAAVKAKKYKYEEQLGFLVPYMEERTTHSNVVASDNQTLSVNSDTDVYQSQLIAGNNEADTGKFGKDVKKNKSNNTNTESASSVLMKYILEKNKSPSRPDQIHNIDAFLSSLAPTLKNFSPYYQNIAKSKIFSIVQNMELDILSQRITTPSSSSISTSDSSQLLLSTFEET
ncbi:hypothetical protein ABEB36_000190 [Hypothenemus hampei]|uniref:MADF domain-containing protein n=1 Tax=Hypothenemus hampei TaxID=57062 RepID=A0ABD1FAH0_HYPHA